MGTRIASPETKKLRGIYFTRYFADGMVYSFLACYFLLAFPGTDNALKLGLLLASMPLMEVLGNVVIGFLAGNSRRNLLLLRILMPIEVAFLVSIGFVRFSFALTLIFSMIANFIYLTIYALLDGISGDSLAREGGKYVSIREFGAVGYLFGAVTAGFIAESFGENSVVGYGNAFLCALPFYAIAYLLINLLHPYEWSLSKEAPQDKKAVRKQEYHDIFHEKDFVRYVIFIAIVMGLLFFTDNTYTDYWNLDENGVNALNNRPSFLGLSTGLMEVGEVSIGLILYFVMRNKDMKKVTLFSALCLFFRCLGLGILTYLDIKKLWGFTTPTMALLMGVNMLRGIAWGAFAASVIPVVENLLGIELKSKGIFIVCIGYGLTNGLGQIAFEYIVNAFKSASGSTGHYPIFFLAAGLILLSLILLPKIRLKPEEKETASA
jgi:MFS family permease